MQDSLLTAQQLTTISLRFSSTAKPLKITAFADLAARGLFLIGKPAKVGYLCSEVAKIIGYPNVDSKFIQEALEFLRLENKVNFESNKWNLTNETKDEISKQIKLLENEISSVINRHFPKSIDHNVLTNWFSSASADFFAFHADELVKTICKNIKSDYLKTIPLQKLLEKSIQKHGLLKNRSDLADGFIAFCNSDNPIDQRYVMSLIFAMFSSKLVSADIGSDPMTIEELKDSTFILDTNVLFAINLDDARIAKSIKALALALKKIKAKLVYLHTTQMEYENTVRVARTRTFEFLKSFPIEVVIDSDDSFMKAARNTKCKTPEDLATFFSGIKKPPLKIGEINITKLDYPEIENMVKKGEVDASLKSMLSINHKKLNPNAEEKGEFSLKHDASLVHVVEGLRENGLKIWAMTIDRNLQTTARERAGDHSISTSIFLEGLIQILAVNNGGPSQDSSDFAPLLTNIIMRRCIPSENTYKNEDLQWLNSLQERVSDFSAPKIKQILEIVKKFRLSGSTANDEHLKLAVDRAYQEIKKDYDQELESEKERRQKAETRAMEIEKSLEKAKQKIIASRKKELVKQATNKLIKRVLFVLIFAIIFSFISFYALKWALPKDRTNILTYGIGIIDLFGILITFFKWPIKKFNHDVLLADSIAKEEGNED